MKGRTIVILGAGGRLGAALLRHYRATDEVIGFNHAQLDLADHAQLPRILGSLDFDVLINCAAQTNVDRCEAQPDEAFATNAEAPRVLAEICALKKARLVHISTDYVFAGDAAAPYREEDEANPISVYGQSKRAGEERVLELSEEHQVVRVSWVFGPDRASFVDWIIEQAAQLERVDAVADKFATPSYTLDLAELLQPLLLPATPGGLWHLANAGECSWQEYGQWALDCCAAEGTTLRAREVGAITLADMKNFVARRPVYSVLATEKYQRLTGQSPRPWKEAVAAFVHQQAKARAQD